MTIFAVWTGLEPATFAVTGRHSNQLNYQTVALLRVQRYTYLLFIQTLFANHLDNFVVIRTVVIISRFIKIYFAKIINHSLQS